MLDTAVSACILSILCIYIYYYVYIIRSEEHSRLIQLYPCVNIVLYVLITCIIMYIYIYYYVYIHRSENHFGFIQRCQHCVARVSEE